MKPIQKLIALSLLVGAQTATLQAQTPASTPNTTIMQTQAKLDAKQQAIVLVAAFTAKGDMPQLEKALRTGLDLGLTISELREVLIQLYAYTGFPRSLNALNNLMGVVKDRKAKGINDLPGREPSPFPTDKSALAFGTENQTRLVGRPISGELYQFAPAIDQFLKTHLFGDIFGRNNLDWKTREVATIAALAAMGGVESQLQGHFGVGRYNGLSDGALIHLVSIIETNVGEREGKEAAQILQKVLAPARSAPGK